MSDDVREVHNPSPFAPVKPAARGEARERLSDEHSQSQGEGRYSDSEEKAPSPAPEALAAEIAEANGRLAASGRRVRLKVAGTPREPAVEIFMLDEAGGIALARRIAPSEVAQWMERIESSEGLLLDDIL